MYNHLDGTNSGPSMSNSSFCNFILKVLAYKLKQLSRERVCVKLMSLTDEIVELK